MTADDMMWARLGVADAKPGDQEGARRQPEGAAECAREDVREMVSSKPCATAGNFCNAETAG